MIRAAEFAVIAQLDGHWRVVLDDAVEPLLQRSHQGGDGIE